VAGVFPPVRQAMETVWASKESPLRPVHAGQTSRCSPLQQFPAPALPRPPGGRCLLADAEDADGIPLAVSGVLPTVIECPCGVAAWGVALGSRLRYGPLPPHLYLLPRGGVITWAMRSPEEGRMQEILMAGPLITVALATMTLLMGLTLAPSGRAATRWREAVDEPPAAGPATSWGDVVLLGLLAIGLAVVAIAVVLRAEHGP
jgi:hypothetical protein